MAAERLGCTPSTVRRRIDSGSLPGVVRGTRVWVEEASLATLVAAGVMG